MRRVGWAWVRILAGVILLMVLIALIVRWSTV